MSLYGTKLPFSLRAISSPFDAGADGLGFYSTSTIIGSPFLIARNTYIAEDSAIRVIDVFKSSV